MQNFKKIWNDENLVKILKQGGIVVMPTDTIYGIVGRVEDRETVEKIYKIRKRSLEKQCIILISDIHELTKFGVEITDEQKEILKNYWQTNNQEPVSIILDCENSKFEYLHRGTNTLAFRLPTNTLLQNLLKQTGPLVAPSANTEGTPPCKNIWEAKNYFGNLVDLYVDGGEIAGKSSKIIRLLKDGSVSIIRD